MPYGAAMKMPRFVSKLTPEWSGAWSGQRVVDELECVLSVALAILVAHRIGASNIDWAAFSGFMVMRGHAGDTLLRGVLRMIGTATGGLLALVAAPLVIHSVAATALALAIVGVGSLYAALTARRAYAWLFFGLTFAMAILDRLEHPGIAIDHFVTTRILEVVAGTSACIAVSLASTLSLRRWWPADRAAPAERIGWHPDAFRHALQGGTALLVLVLATAIVAVPAPAQSAVTIMAVMLVPVSGIGRSGLAPVWRRIAHRSVGTAAGAAFAAPFLFAAQGAAPLLILGALAGVAIGRHIENGPGTRAYVGTQFVLAVLVTLVPDSYPEATIEPGLERLAATVVGLVLVVPVLLAWHWLGPRRGEEAAAGPVRDTGANE